MSTRAMRWAFDEAHCPFKHEAILLRIARDVDATGTASIDQVNLAEVLGITERTVRDHMATLEELGIIERHRPRREDGTFDHTVITLVGYPVTSSPPEAPPEAPPEELRSPPEELRKTPANDHRKNNVASRARGNTESSFNSPSTQSNVVEEGTGREQVAGKLMKAKGWPMDWSDTVGLLVWLHDQYPKHDLMELANKAVAASFSSPIRSPGAFLKKMADDTQPKVPTVFDNPVQDDERILRYGQRQDDLEYQWRKRHGLLREGEEMERRLASA